MFSSNVIDQQSPVAVVGIAFRTHVGSFRGMRSAVRFTQRTFREGHRTMGALEFPLLLVDLHVSVETVAERDEELVDK